jgi:hypothetical protein
LRFVAAHPLLKFHSGFRQPGFYCFYREKEGILYGFSTIWGYKIVLNSESSLYITIMGNKKSKPRMYGLAAGIVVGVAIGFAQRSWIQKTLNGEFVHVLNTLTLILCAVIGYMVGRAIDKRKTVQDA